MAAVALFSLLAPWTRSGLLATRAMILATRAMISRSLGAVGLPNMGAANFLVSYTTLAHRVAPASPLGRVLRVYCVLKDDISRDKKRRAYQFVGLRIHKREYLSGHER